MKSKVLACLLLGFVATGAFATEWTYIGISSDNLNLYAYERDGIRNSPEGILAWIAEINSDPKLSYDLSLQVLTFDCDRFRFRFEQTTYYLKGKVKHQSDGKFKWIFATPGSVGEAWVKNTCNRYKSDYVYRNNDWQNLTIWGKDLLKKSKAISESNF